MLFTDGVDTTSKRASYESNITDAQELDALIYPVQYDTSRDMNAGNFPPMGGPVDIWGQILGGIFGGGGGGRHGGRRGGGSYPPPGGSRDDYELASRYLLELANSTGGRQYPADSLNNMSSAFANVAEELRRQYSIGYYPPHALQDGKWHRISIRAKDRRYHVRARKEYFGK